jgi:hypothetical protein
MFRAYTRPDDGAAFATKDCPMHEGPLHLIPDSLRAEVDRLRRARDGSRSTTAAAPEGSGSPDYRPAAGTDARLPVGPAGGP